MASNLRSNPVSEIVLGGSEQKIRIVDFGVT